VPAPPLPPGPLILRRRRPWDLAGSPVGGLPASPLLIPYEWIGWPVARQPTTAINSATITQDGGVQARATNAASITLWTQSTAEATLFTDCDADPANLASFLMTYYSTPRPRQPTLPFNLLARADDECRTLLGAGLGRRVRIVHAPTTWPPGACNFTIEGIRNTIAVDQRLLVWSTAAVVGTTTTDPGPWFRWDSSSWGGTDQRPF